MGCFIFPLHRPSRIYIRKFARVLSTSAGCASNLFQSYVHFASAVDVLHTYNPIWRMPELPLQCAVRCANVSSFKAHINERCSIRCIRSFVCYKSGLDIFLLCLLRGPLLPALHISAGVYPRRVFRERLCSYIPNCLLSK